MPFFAAGPPRVCGRVRASSPFPSSTFSSLLPSVLLWQHYTGPHGLDRRGKAEIYVALSNGLRSFSSLKFTEILSAGEGAIISAPTAPPGTTGSAFSAALPCAPRRAAARRPVQCARLLPFAAGVLFSVTALQTGPMLTGLIPPSGKEVTVPLFEVARVAPDGRFVETWSSLDKVRVLGRARRAPSAARVGAARNLRSPPPPPQFMVFAQAGVFDGLKAQFPDLKV